MTASKPDGQSLADSLLAQTAAGITLAAALIYAAGALTVALRLYFTHLPWEAVLGQLPHDLLLTTGFGQIVLPASIIGMLGAILLNFLINHEHGPNQGRWAIARAAQSWLRDYLQDEPGPAHFASWVTVSLLLGAAEAGIALPDYLYHRSRYLYPSVVISWPRFFLVVAAISAITASIALILFPWPLPLPGRTFHSAATDSAASAAPNNAEQRRESKLRPWQWQATVGSLVALAVIPGVAAISASSLFPYTLACSPSFKNGQLSGNLIGTNAGWAYMVEYRSQDRSHDYFSVIPLASVRLMTIGQYADCNPLAPSPAPSASP